jgi:hypothetical protein
MESVESQGITGTLPGLHQDSRYILVVSQASQNVPGVLVESCWAPSGVPGVLGSPPGTRGAV